MVLSLVVICFVLMIFTPWLIRLIAPGFSSEKLSLTVQLTRIMFLSPFFLGLSAIFGGILQSFRRFLIYSLAPIMYNLGIIFGVLFLVKPFGLLGLAYGVILGAFLHLIIQIPTTYLCGFRWKPVLDFKFEGVKRVFKMMPPRIVSLALSQITLIIMTALASLLAIGSITVYNFAYNIWSFPLGVFGISFSLAVFPELSKEVKRKNIPGFVKIFSATIKKILLFIIPSSILFFVLRKQIVMIILGVSQFGIEDIIITSQTLGYFSIGLFAEALVLLSLRGFFAFEDTKTPLMIGLLVMIVRLSIAWHLSTFMGVPGLALGFSIGSILYLILLSIALKKKINAY